MEGPSIEVVPEFANGEGLIEAVRAELGARDQHVIVRFSDEPWPGVVRSMRQQLEQRCGHPMTECWAEWHPDRKLDVYRPALSVEALAPGSRVAIVSAGASRTMRFRQLGGGDRSFEQPLQPGTLLLIDDRNLRRWRPELALQGIGGANARLVFRYALTAPQ